MRHRKMGALCRILIGFSLMLTLALYGGSGFSVDAEDETGMSITATTELRNQPTFRVSIPQTIPIGELQRAATEGSYAEKSFSVSITGAENLGEQTVSVRISTEDGTFRLYSDSYALPYEIKQGNTILASGDVFATFSAQQNEAVSGKVVLDRYDIVAAGEYTGVLTFTVSVSDGTED